MKITDYLKSLPKGEVITNKRVLSVLKRAGIIYDYSFGYLESHWVYYKSTWNGKEAIEHELTYSGKEIKDGEIGSRSNPYESREAMIADGWGTYIDAEYKGFKLGSKYLSGCFNAYLYKVDGPCENDKVVNRTMSIFGAVV